MRKSKKFNKTGYTKAAKGMGINQGYVMGQIHEHPGHRTHAGIGKGPFVGKRRGH